MEETNLVSDIKFDDRGLVPVVVQDVDSGAVLMLAYTNKEALRLTLTTGDAWFFSRSRQKLWHKGETSGNFIRVVSVWKDCDSDTILILGKPLGPACHTGHTTCFFQQISEPKNG
ncbi:MAG: phosphoribosyl-AMP cyclohydrolase [Dehalococcoidales bacterium]|nr:phosphoribosyl-AMP cyclohydrolase [Dehalococcoidales bacterium]